MLKPYRFEAFLRPMLWGGDAIARFKGIACAQNNIGESWEICAVAGHESRTAARGIEGDEDTGLLLSELIDKYRERLVGKAVYRQFGNQFPLLIKFIDAHQDLSIQVHPNDALARERHQCPGKTEMWYIIHAEQGAKIFSGLSQAITSDEYERLAKAEVVDGHSPMQDVVAVHDSHAGDVFYLPAGRLHSIGTGNLLAEIQQSSDITYRVYDYGRRDAQGRTRELHIAEAKEAIDYTVYADYRTEYDHGMKDVQLTDCPYFRVHRLLTEGEQTVDLHSEAFVVVMCVEGECVVNGLRVRQGETILLPAEDNVLRCQGKATLLATTM